jgi:hypothetical protein
MIEFTKENQEETHLTVARLELLRRLVESQNEGCIKDVNEWESDDWNV